MIIFWCPRNFTDSRKKSDLSGVTLKNSIFKNWWLLLRISSIVSIVVSCIKMSSTYVVTLFWSMRRLNILLINEENAAGPIEKN